MQIQVESGKYIEAQITSLEDYLNRSFGKKFLYAPALSDKLFWQTHPKQHHSDLLTAHFGTPDTDEGVDQIAQNAEDNHWKAWGGFWNPKTKELAVYRTPEFGGTEMDNLRPLPDSIVSAIAKQLDAEPEEISIIEARELKERIEQTLQEHQVRTQRAKD